MSEKIKIGFTALTDSAPLVVAKELGFFANLGLDVELCKEVSWSNIRDKLVFGEYQAAHLLAPMLMSCTLGLGGFKKPLCTAYSFGLNGNAISVSNAVFAELEAVADNLIDAPEQTASALASVIQQRAAAGLPKLRFAVVFPYSMHYYLLNHWLVRGGIALEQVDIMVVPPARVVQALAEDVIDGYCVGEPWNSHAALEGVGVTLITGYEIWNNAPEKVLGVTQEWADAHEDEHAKLVQALHQASAWIDQAENHPQLMTFLSQPEYVGVPQTALEYAFAGKVCHPTRQTCRLVPEFAKPYKDKANLPKIQDALWILTQMQTLGQIPQAVSIHHLATEVYRPDLTQTFLHI